MKGLIVDITYSASIVNDTVITIVVVPCVCPGAAEEGCDRVHRL